jgi:hypothetical protein
MAPSFYRKLATFASLGELWAMKRQGTREAKGHGPCSVCGLRDARALVMVDLSSGVRVTLCGTHELMHRRTGSRARSVEELKAAFKDRRGTDRRGYRGEVDELAQRLDAAFMKDRRGTERRAG